MTTLRKAIGYLFIPSFLTISFIAATSEKRFPNVANGAAEAGVMLLPFVIPAWEVVDREKIELKVARVEFLGDGTAFRTWAGFCRWYLGVSRAKAAGIAIGSAVTDRHDMKLKNYVDHILD